MLTSKQSLRESIQYKLLAQSLVQRKQKSALLGQKLLACPEYCGAHTVLFFVSLPEEVDTHRLIDEALKTGKRVVVPRCQTETKALELYEIRDRKHLVPGVLGLLEPDPAVTKPVSAEEADLVLVPGVVFDRQGNRIGRGAGFYDRFLKALKPSVFKMGLAYAFQIVPSVPVEPHDVKLDRVLTEED